MFLAAALPCAVAAAGVYGVSTAVQHSAAHIDSASPDAHRLIGLLRDPRWLLSIGGDTVGLVLQVLALSMGPVVLVQPLLVLTLPVTLVCGWLMSRARPHRGDVLAILAILAGLSLFFALVGDPGNAAPLRAGAAGLAAGIALVAGGIACLAAVRRRPPVRAAIYGAVAGGWFGLVGVLLNATATAWRDHGLSAFGRAGGLVPLVALLVVGAVGIALTQVSFQIGELGASFPANKAADPIVAVALGGALLHEHVPAGAPYLVAYLACFAVMLAGTIRLANPPGATVASDPGVPALRESHNPP